MTSSEEIINALEHLKGWSVRGKLTGLKSHTNYVSVTQIDSEITRFKKLL